MQVISAHGGMRSDQAQNVGYLITALQPLKTNSHCQQQKTYSIRDNWSYTITHSMCGGGHYCAGRTLLLARVIHIPIECLSTFRVV